MNLHIFCSAYLHERMDYDVLIFVSGAQFKNLTEMCLEMATVHCLSAYPTYFENNLNVEVERVACF